MTWLLLMMVVMIRPNPHNWYLSFSVLWKNPWTEDYHVFAVVVMNTTTMTTKSSLCGPFLLFFLVLTATLTMLFFLLDATKTTKLDNMMPKTSTIAAMKILRLCWMCYEQLVKSWLINYRSSCWVFPPLQSLCYVYPSSTFGLSILISSTATASHVSCCCSIHFEDTLFQLAVDYLVSFFLSLLTNQSIVQVLISLIHIILQNTVFGCPVTKHSLWLTCLSPITYTLYRYSRKFTPPSFLAEIRYPLIQVVQLVLMCTILHTIPTLPLVWLVRYPLGKSLQGYLEYLNPPRVLSRNHVRSDKKLCSRFYIDKSCGWEMSQS